MADLLVVRGLEKGCLVEAQAVPDGTVKMSGGGLIFDNLPVGVPAAPVIDLLGPNPADPLLDRYDAIAVDSTGADVVFPGVAGVPGPVGDLSAVFGTALVKIRAGAGDIQPGDIQDARLFVSRTASPYRVAGGWVCAIGSRARTGGWLDGDCFATPIFLERALPISHIAARCAVAGTAGTKGRLGYYADDGAGNTALVADVGQVALDVTLTAPRLAVSDVLDPGWWWLAIAFQSIGATPPNMDTLDYVYVTPLGIPDAALAPTGKGGGVYLPGITGALPSTLDIHGAANLGRTNLPTVFVQAA